MPKAKKAVARASVLDLVRDEHEAFIAAVKKDGGKVPPIEVMDLLAKIAMQPKLLLFVDRMKWWRGQFLKQPGFVLGYMHAMRQAAFAKTPAEQCLTGPTGHVLDRVMTDGELALHVEEVFGVRTTPRSWETARAKIKARRRKSNTSKSG